jgi:hypothetical protein
VPLIRAPSGGPAEMLAQELTGLLRESLQPARGSSNPPLLTRDVRGGEHLRPLLLILDRSCDMT